MAFQPRADLQNQAIGWLQGIQFLDGGTGYDLRKPGGHLGNVGAKRENWTATRGALQWLAETVQTLPPPDEKRS